MIADNFRGPGMVVPPENVLVSSALLNTFSPDGGVGGSSHPLAVTGF